MIDKQTIEAIQGDMPMYGAIPQQLKEAYIKTHPICEECKRRPAVDITYKENKQMSGYLRFYDIKAVCDTCVVKNVLYYRSKVFLVNR